MAAAPKKTLTLTVELKDGRSITFEIGGLKPTAAIFSEVEKQIGERPSKLFVDGTEVELGKMIKNVLKNGDILRDGSLIPEEAKKLKYRDPFLFEKLRSGAVSEDEILQIDFQLYKRYKLFVYKEATVDDLKEIIKQLFGKTGEIYVQKGTRQVPLGWTGNLNMNSRMYDGTKSLISSGIQTGSSLGMFDLPETFGERIRKEKQKAWEEENLRRRMNEHWWETRGQFTEEGKAKIAKEKREREKTQRWFEEFERHARSWGEPETTYSRAAGASPPPHAEAPPPTENSSFVKCKAKLDERGIKSKKDFRKWAALGGHPNKGGATEDFQDLQNCVNLVYPEEGGKRTRKQRRGRRGTRKN